MSEWHRVPFDAAIDFREGPGIMAADFHEEGIPLIRLAGLTADRSLLTKCNFLDPEKVKAKWSHFRVELGDVLLSTSASLGRVAVVSEEAAVGAIPYTGIIRMRPASGELHPGFLPWLLRSPDFVRQVEHMGVGSVMNHFGPSHLRKMNIALPPLPEQRRIASVLGAFDDLIETNRRMATALDETARVAWRGHVAEFDLRSVPLSEMANVVLGGTPKRSNPEYWGGHLPWLNSGKANEFRVMEGSEGITQSGFDKSSTKLLPRGATLVAITGATLGKVTRTGIDACGNQSLVGVYVDDDCPLNDHIYLSVSDDIEQVTRHATGGAQQHVNKGNVEQMLVPSLTPDLLAAIRTDVTPLLASVEPLLAEADKLARTRDELLPLLMSGKVRVEDVELPKEAA